MGGVLEGVRVLDFGHFIAGPYCATLPTDTGAEVIRVEKRDGSEDRFVAPVGEGGEGALFLQINRNKKCITLDPMKSEGQEVMRRLVTTADVVAAADSACDEAGLRIIEGDQVRHHTDDGDCIRRPAALVRPRLRQFGQVMSGSVYMTGSGVTRRHSTIGYISPVEFERKVGLA